MSTSSASAASIPANRFRRPLRLAATLLALAACPAAESVSVTLKNQFAYESDSVDGFGEFVISRAQAQTTPLAVRITISGTTTDTSRDTFNVGNSSGGNDYRIEAVPASAGPVSSLGVTEIVTIPAGQKEVSLRVIAYRDGDNLVGELGEGVNLQVLSDGNSGKTYIVTDAQQKTVQIIDANITAQMITVANPAEKIGTDVNGTLRIIGAVGRIDCLFADSSVRDAYGSIRSYSPYVRTVSLGDQTLSGRYVEFLIGGTATRGTDYTLTYKIGSLTPGEKVDQPFAYRLKAENGQDILNKVAGYASFSDLAISPALDLPAQYYNLRVVSGLPGTFTFAGYGGFALNDEAKWGDLDGDGVLNENPTNTGNPAPTITGNAITRVDAAGTRSRIILKNAIASDIRQGTKLVIRYDVLKKVTTTPTSGPAVTTLSPETIELNCQIDENIVYPKGASSMSVRGVPAQSISVGDIFELSTDPGMRYRVTGPTPSGTRSNSVNADASGVAITSVGASNVTSSFISFWPPLRKALTRDDGTTNLVDEFAVDLPNDQDRFTLHIPGLPHSVEVHRGALSYADGNTTTTGLYPDGTWNGTDSDGNTYPNDMPSGDSIGFRVNVLDDQANEGAETVTISAQTSNANNNYAILNPGVASVVISDNDSVAVVSVVKNVFEGGDGGQFKVTFTKPFTKDIEVPYTLLSTGLTNPANWRDGFPRTGAPADILIDKLDAVTGTGSVTLKAGSTSVDILVNAIPDQAIESVQQIKLQLQDSSDYVLVSGTESPENASAATMTVTDSVGVVTLTDPDTKSIYEEPATTDPRPTFKVQVARRAGYENQPLTVKLDLSGSAVQDFDYQLTLPAGATRNGSRLEIPIPNGSSSADIVLQPLTDTLTETDETVIATLVDGDTFRLGDKKSGQATIKNGVPPVVNPPGGGTTVTNTTSGNPNPPPTTASAGGSVEQNQGSCGAGGAVALMSGLLFALGLRRRQH